MAGMLYAGFVKASYRPLSARGEPAASANQKPSQTGDQVREEDIWQLAVRPLRHGIEIANQGQQHGRRGQPGNDLSALMEGSMLPQVAGQGKADQRISHDETVGCQ